MKGAEGRCRHCVATIRCRAQRTVCSARVRVGGMKHAFPLVPRRSLAGPQPPPPVARRSLRNGVGGTRNAQGKKLGGVSGAKAR